MWFTSDTHYGHNNIIKYCNRPFADIEAMNAALIERWNQRVKPQDWVFHLGDFAMGGGGAGGNAKAILDRLAGHKVLIRGNHDRRARLADGWEAIHDYHLLNWQSQPIVLCHYAMRIWDRSHHGSWMLYGHSHGTLPDDPTARSIDVGVDCHDYRPISVAEVATIMATKRWEPIDHHGRAR